MSSRSTTRSARTKRDRINVTRAPNGRIVNAEAVTDLKPFRALGEALAENLEGEVRFDDGSRALYATDASNYRQVPIGVVVPRTIQDVIAAFDLCRRFGAPIVPRGGGTSLAGQGCNVAVLIDYSKYLHRIISIDAVNKLARVEPGCVLDHLRDAAEAARPHLRARSGDPRPQHARRHARQQFLRRAFGDGGAYLG